MNKLAFAASLAAILIGGCQTIQVQPQKGLGNIYGTVSVRSHKAIIAKAETATGNVAGDYETTDDGKLVYTKTMVNYDDLDEIYVGIIGANSKRGMIHNLKASDRGIIPRSIALATGDVIRITNGSSKPLTFFLAGLTSDAFDELPPLAPGASGNLTVGSSGEFELGTDEDERVTAAVLVRPGMAVKRISSGSSYLFKNLKPGRYRMLFWYWRLGIMERRVSVKADQSTKQSATLAVDTLVR